jgi:glycosyltransferase involved in cell wall biosynthesis
MREGGLDVRMVVPGHDPTLQRPFVESPFPTSFNSIAYGLFSERSVVSFTAWTFLRSLRSREVVYLWPGTPRWLYERVKEKGLVLVAERINTHRRTAKAILDDAYARLGLVPTQQFTEESIADEEAKLALADLIFSPSPAVTASLISAGIDARKIIRSSYGWEPRRLGGKERPVRTDDSRIFLFMGRVCIRKGAHLLLEAWARAGVKGKLILVGEIDDEIRRLSGPLLARADVEARPYTPDVASVYANADVFVLPTLEEGSPLVVYEAMASSLPVVTTPIGGGELVRNEEDGLLIEPQDVVRLTEAIRRLALERETIERMRESARVRAQRFTWSSVGKRRAELLRSALPDWR